MMTRPAKFVIASLIVVLHGQNGVAPNGGELHPILCISVGGNCG